MAVSPDIIEALRRLNPSTPADHAQYVDRAWDGMPRSWDLPERLEVLIQAGYRVRALLHGPIGVGKTTELRRWAEALRGVATVVYVVVDDTARWSSWSGFVTWNLHNELPPNVPAPDPMEPLQHAIAYLEALRGLPVLLLVDGLDTLPDTIKRLGDGSELADPALPSVVYVVPHAGIVSSRSQTRDPRFEHIWALPPFGVVNPDGSAHEPAVQRLAEGLLRRLSGLEILTDPEAQAREVAFLCGGVPRDAVRSLHAAVLAAAKVGRVNAAHLARGLHEVRQDLTQSLSSADLELLRTIARTGNHEGAWHLVANNAIIGYEAEDQRYWRPHPLLMPLLRGART